MTVGRQHWSGSARLWLVLFFLLMAVLAQFHHLRGDGDDDLRYATALANQSLWDWLGERYRLWSGRTVIDAVTLLIVPHVWLWRLLNAFFAVLLLWAIAGHLGKVGDPGVMKFLVIGFFLMDAEMLRSAVWWISGSFNYLWAMALAAFACLAFTRPETPRKLFFVTIPAAIYSASQEQSGLLLLGFQGLLGWRLFQQGLLGRWHLVQALATVVSFAIVLLSPGSLNRYGVHVRYWFPEYGALTLPERVFSGLQMAFGHAFGTGYLLGVVFCVLLLTAVVAQQRSVVDRFIAVVPLTVTLLPFTLHHAGSETGMLRYWAGQDGRSYLSYWIGSVENAGNGALYGSFLLSLIAAVCVAVSLWTAYRQNDRSAAVVTVVVWMSALMITAVVGLSPSLYSSGQRIYFFQDVLTLALAASLYSKVASARARQFLLWVMTPVALIGVVAAV